MYKIACILLYLLLSVQAQAQDTMNYCQDKAVLFFNCYSLYRVHAVDRTGTFRHVIGSDDGQFWVSEGTFRESRRKLRLHYNFLSPVPYFKAIPDTTQDTLVVKLHTVLGAEPFFVAYCYNIDRSARANDTSRRPGFARDEYFSRSYLTIDNSIRIPASEKIDFIQFMTIGRPSHSFKLPIRRGTLIIYYNEPEHMHLDNTKAYEILKKRRYGLRAKDVWVREKKRWGRFVQRQG